MRTPRDIARAFCSHRFAEAYDSLAPDVRWVSRGGTTTEGRQAVIEICEARYANWPTRPQSSSASSSSTAATRSPLTRSADTWTPRARRPPCRRATSSSSGEVSCIRSRRTRWRSIRQPRRRAELPFIDSSLRSRVCRGFSSKTERRGLLRNVLRAPKGARSVTLPGQVGRCSEGAWGPDAPRRLAEWSG